MVKTLRKSAMKGVIIIFLFSVAVDCIGQTTSDTPFQIECYRMRFNLRVMLGVHANEVIRSKQFKRISNIITDKKAIDQYLSFEKDDSVAIIVKQNLDDIDARLVVLSRYEDKIDTLVMDRYYAYNYRGRYHRINRKLLIWIHEYSRSSSDSKKSKSPFEPEDVFMTVETIDQLRKLTGFMESKEN